MKYRKKPVVIDAQQWWPPGGPKDGFVGFLPIIEEPGKMPLLLHKGSKGRRYVYQARRLRA